LYQTLVKKKIATVQHFTLSMSHQRLSAQPTTNTKKKKETKKIINFH
jgi:hypothetical protein